MTPVRVAILAVLAVGVCLIGAVLTMPARSAEAAIPRCFPLPLMTKTLRESFQEYVVATGAMGPNQSFAIASSSAGTFTAIIITKGVACIALAGTQFEMPEG